MAADADAVLERVEEKKSVLAGLLAPYRVLKGNRDFDFIFMGQSVSLLGDWLYIVALIVIAFSITHSATFVSLLTFTRLSPYALFMPFTGALADRVNRRVLLVTANSARGICVLGLLFIDSKSTIWLAFPLVFCITTMASVFRPALQSTLPAVVEGEDLTQANSLLSQVESISFVLGPGLGGFFVVLGHPQLAFAVTGTAYLLSAAAFLSINSPPTAAEERPVDTSWLGHTMAGFRFLFKENEGVLAAFILTIAAAGLLGGAFWTLILVLAEDTFRLGGQGTGYLNSAYGAGGLLGGILVNPLLSRFRVNQLFIAGAFVCFVMVILIGISPLAVFAFLFLVIFGIGDVATTVAGVTVIQTATPGELMGRVFGAFESSLVGAMLIGTLAAGPLIAAVGPRATAVILACVSLLVLGLCLTRLRRMEDVLGVRIFLRQVPVLTVLSLQVIDDFASRVRIETFDRGAEIVREGEHGDHLYILKSGDVEVYSERNGNIVPLATLSKLDYFGEIALLKDVPRTATVRALVPVETYSLSRTDFEELLRKSEELEQSFSGTGEARLLDTQSKLMTTRL